MRLYAVLDRLFPGSFAAKVFFVAFIGTHIPLIATVIYAVGSSLPFAEFLPVLGLVFAATLLGSAATIVSIWALLEPVRMARRSFKALEGDTIQPRLPDHYRDELGYMMRTINRVSDRLGRRLVAAEQAALEDPLTGCLNRRGFLESVPHQPEGTVIYADLDHFKRINDLHGHAVGDEVLRDAAEALRRELRGSDVLARFGGEEFVVWLSPPRPEAVQVAERLRLSVATRVRARGDVVTASLGVAAARPGAGLDEVLDAADRALLAAKEAGRNRVVVAGDAADPGAGPRRDADRATAAE